MRSYRRAALVARGQAVIGVEFRFHLGGVHFPYGELAVMVFPTVDEFVAVMPSYLIGAFLAALVLGYLAAVLRNLN